eukprot:CAMPEP_0202365958 /NCGR_PEP_ID=MMETSP1126-20121109/16771_1 /ASSEMBLY_ACC=CAM_ASM_000457 /TAXON_ID=3047 /ORGANISM="Dunaliella tertiolecta, Strain CCMP1320" /LENGTH=82 /DNA_ID=CAMNT_0048960931 /DNA_START=800 /DNA_END=1048 /DNA_ORIENTATION=-
MAPSGLLVREAPNDLLLRCGLYRLPLFCADPPIDLWNSDALCVCGLMSLSRRLWCLSMDGLWRRGAWWLRGTTPGLGGGRVI